jgi:hypothetical protein
MSAPYPPSIELTHLYEKTSQRGTRYFVGRLGLARITLLPGDAVEDGTATWRVMLQDAPRAPASTDRPSTSPRPPPYARRRQAERPNNGAPMPDDPISDLWPESAP